MKFPILGKRLKWVPWDVIAAHARQAQANHSQTLEQLAKRGGLSPCELLAVLEDRPWRGMKITDAEQQLEEKFGCRNASSSKS